MNHASIALLLSALFLASCSSNPNVTIAFSEIGKNDLKGKIIAVAGLTAKGVMRYPGQVAEMTVLNDAVR